MTSKLLRFVAGALDYVRGRNPLEVTVKGCRLLRREGLAGFRRILLGMAGLSYGDWIDRHDTLNPQDRQAIHSHIYRFSWRPVISVLMPVYNPPPEFLRLAIASVRRQLYVDWELCIADDGSSVAEVRTILEEAAASDPRIRVVFRATNGHISAATNTALEIARGDFIALLDHDDELAEHALYHVAAALNDNPELDLIYSDEDKIDAVGHRFGHYFKPDWNPDLFLAQNMICHLSVYRRNLANAVGGFRTGYEGSQDWDFALRVVDCIPTKRIGHIARVLYHWRAIAGSTAVSIGAKDYAIDAGKRALLDHWQRRGVSATVTPVEAGHFTTHLPLPQSAPLASIIICTRNRLDLLRQCLEGIDALTDYPNIELIIVDNGSDDEATLRYLAERSGCEHTRVLRDDGSFNFSALNNRAVRQAQGTVLCLLNNDVVPIKANWLSDMVAHALRTEIGAVGAKLYYPDGSIQHAGIILDGVAAGHLHLGHPGGTSGYGNRARLPQNFSAVTAACLVVRKNVWNDVDGLDEAFAVAFNDVDFCLRVQQKGYRNLWLPQAELHHHESASRGKEDTPEKQARFSLEVDLLRQRWGQLIEADPAWNPNLALNGANIGLASPIRTAEPWTHFNGGPV